ncbi:sel1 repeat family protein [Sphingosinithalassobacter portus]|uniref:sel1 repeat family protein n=1 Tax=Stakelama portus TaxID=2676234 RepID=UPI000D6DC5A5|nr:sel1 repeat family protein [Sphingosinithalassobacter portus]
MLGLDRDEICASRWEEIRRWEQAYAERGGWLGAETDETWALLTESDALRLKEPHQSFALMQCAAAMESPFALETIGWHYWTGTLVEADRDVAIDHYFRSARAGSWVAMLAYSNLLNQAGHPVLAEKTLEDCVGAGFAPAHYRLAMMRLERSLSRADCRAVRPLLDYARDHGHPAATGTLGALMLRGKFGPTKICEGLRMVLGADDRKAGLVVPATPEHEAPLYP